MTADADDAFAERLAALDAELAAGNTPAVDPADTPDLCGRLRRGLHALHALRDLRPPLHVPPAAEPAPPRIGRFDVLRELGRGGFGVVLLARDPELHRDVALKVPHAAALLDETLRERFRREARAAAGLDHPNIVAVYEVGDAGPVCYIASAYVPGPNLAARLRDHPALLPRDAAELVAVLADAVAYAHQRGVVHRDLKPANVLLAQKSQAPKSKCQTGPGSDWDLDFGAWDFSPKVSDFGLAKLADAGEPLTRSGAALGTPSYMAPEQARGQSGVVGPAADVYALGAILYECLTGRPPFRGESDVETLQQVCGLDPVPPRRLRPAVPRDLDTVCLKCLEKDPARRYASAAALADDLYRVVAGRPVAARPVGPFGKLRRWTRRKPVVAGLAAALAAAVVVGVAGVGREYCRAERERDTAVAERDRTGRLLGQARDSLGEMITLGHNLVHAPPTVGQGLDILAVARRYHNTLLQEDPGNTAIREQAVLICRRLALIRGERGEKDAADAAWAEAAAHAEALATGPDGERHRAAFVTLIANWAEPLCFHGRFADCLAAAERGLPTARALAAERSDDLVACNGLVEVQYWRGMALRRLDRWPEAVAAYGEALALVRRHSPGYTARYGIGPEHNCLCRLAEGYAVARDLAASEACAREAVEMMRAAVERRPADADLQMKLAASLNVLGRPLYSSKQWQAAVDAYRESNRIFDTRPDLTAFVGGGYQAYQRAAAAVARALAELGRPDEAAPDLTAAVRLPPPPPRAGLMNPTPPELFECYAHLIELTLRRGDVGAARALQAEAVGRLPPPGARADGELKKWAELLTALGPKLEAKSAP